MEDRPQSVFSTLELVLKCGSCRFAAYYLLSFLVALIDGGKAQWFWIVLAVPFWLMHSLAIELLNRYSDRTEDQINRPERTALCDELGYPKIKRFAYSLWALIAAIYIFWIGIVPSPFLFALLFAAIFVGISYSVGVRFKAKRYLALIVLAFPFGGPFLIAWAATHTGISVREAAHDIFIRLGPSLLIAGLFFLSHAGIKDITDIAGDRTVEYKSIWADLVEERAYGVALAFTSLPFLFSLLFGVAVLGYSHLLWLLIFWPVSVFFAITSLRAGTFEERNIVREMFYHYWFLFIALSLFLIRPTGAVALTIGGTFSYWWICTQFLHWSSGVSIQHITKLSGILRRSRAKPLHGHQFEGVQL